jgi:hypothetical protein
MKGYLGCASTRALMPRASRWLIMPEIPSVDMGHAVQRQHLRSPGMGASADIVWQHDAAHQPRAPRSPNEPNAPERPV